MKFTSHVESIYQPASQTTGDGPVLCCSCGRELPAGRAPRVRLDVPIPRSPSGLTLFLCRQCGVFLTLIGSKSKP